jgi:hypothetical protein
VALSRILLGVGCPSSFNSTSAPLADDVDGVPGQGVGCPTLGAGVRALQTFIALVASPPRGDPFSFNRTSAALRRQQTASWLVAAVYVADVTVLCVRHRSRVSVQLKSAQWFQRRLEGFF